jgi:Tol biopolymer transport system component
MKYAKILVTLTLAAAAISFAWIYPPCRGTFSPDGRKVLYISREFGLGDIFAINVDGTGKTRLTAFADYAESEPVFLPGGEEILFEVYGSGKEAGIWVMNADGSGKKELLADAAPLKMAVSPDAKKISYVETCINISERILYFVTYVADLDGSSRFMLTGEDGESTNEPVSFSPDGKKLLYDVGGRVYVVNADGSGRKALTPRWDIIESPVFFADGAKIAFVVRSSAYPYPSDIYTMDADGSNLELFKATEPMGPSDLVVSPTGDRFLFRSFYEEYPGNGERDYFAVNADGSGLVRLSEYNPPPYDEEEE